MSELKKALDVGSGPYPCMDDRYDWVHLEPNDYPHVEVKAVGWDIPLKDETFDLVRNSCVIEHIEVDKQELFVSEQLRVLKDGGIFEMVVADAGNLFENAKDKSPQGMANLEAEKEKIINGVEGPGMAHTCFMGLHEALALLKKFPQLRIAKIDRDKRAPRDIIILGIKESRKPEWDGPLVSIIIPCKDYGKYLPRTIESAIDQSYPKIEIIVVDDGSIDNSVEVASVYPVQLIKHEKNLGLPFARNTGIRASKGELIICLDADDMLSEIYVETCVSVFKQGEGKNVGIIRTGLTTFNEEGASKQGTPPLPLTSLADELIANRIFVSSMFTREAWEKVGGYSEYMNDGFEDWEFWVKILKEGFTLATVDAPLFFYRIHPDSKGKSREAHRTIESMYQLFVHHRDLYNAVFLPTIPGLVERYQHE